MAQIQFSNYLLVFVFLCSIAGCSSSQLPMEDELNHGLQADGSSDHNPEPGTACSGKVMYSVPYDASQWGPLPNNNLRVRIYPDRTLAPIEADCDCEEIAYFVVFDLPQTAIHTGWVRQPGSGTSTLDYEYFVVEESPSSAPGPLWTPPVSTFDPYPFDMNKMVEINFKVDNDYPVSVQPANRVARVEGICIVGDIPDHGSDALWIDFEHVPGP